MSGLALLAATSLALAGCAAPATRSGGAAAVRAPSASPSPKRTPKDAVLAAAMVLKQTTYRFGFIDGEYTATVLVDPAGGKAAGSLTLVLSEIDTRTDVIQIGNTVWMKVDAGGGNRALGIPTQYMHVQSTKLKDPRILGFASGSADSIAGGELLDCLVDAQRADPVHFTATLDLTRRTIDTVAKKTREKLGDKARKVPAEITVDDQGRLVKLVVQLAALIPVTSMTITYGDFGTPVTVNPPPKAQTVEAPAKVYDLLNSAV
jgi:hypothetical protein